ncbi:heparin lyase I family protein [Bradyrhizobium sp. Tv2a-2]|uniref:heparin lyase I family protein n=1 Tax=Bradyrhizobium sp. Tv2a-2 TaxID=113395 RepID=UPI000465F75B|nr:heparin lyase I family protein [Bradyrhizobium sp. Tv2a-2]
MLRQLNKMRTRRIAVIAVPTIVAAAGSIANLYDGLTFLATTTADAGDRWNFVETGLSDVHSFAATDTDTAGNTSVEPRPADSTVAPPVTSFSATPRTAFYIGNDKYEVQTAGQSYSLTNPDAQTLRFEIQPGDRAWYDSKHAVDRAEIEGKLRIPVGTVITIDYRFMLEPGAANMASWFVTGELHNEDSEAGVPTSPPVAIELAGEHLRVVARYSPTGLKPGNPARNVKMLSLWTDPNEIQRGRYYDIKMRTNVTNSGQGFLDVWVDGVEVVNYRGPLGYGFPTYWMQGLYRSADQPLAIAANFQDLIITTEPTPP